MFKCIRDLGCLVLGNSPSQPLVSLHVSQVSLLSLCSLSNLKCSTAQCRMSLPLPLSSHPPLSLLSDQPYIPPPTNTNNLHLITLDFLPHFLNHHLTSLFNRPGH